MAQYRQSSETAQRKGQTDEEKTRVERRIPASIEVEEYKICLPVNAARVLEWLAASARKNPTDYIEGTVLDHLHRKLTQLDDREAEDILQNKGIPGEWDWKESEFSTVEAAKRS